MSTYKLQEAVVTPKSVTNKLREEFQSLLDDAGVMDYGLRVSPRRTNKLKGIDASTTIYGFVIPNINNGEYDADEVDIALRLAHRLISKWLVQKEADGQLVDVDQHSDVGGGRKFSMEPYRIWVDSKYIKVPGFHVSVAIAKKKDTSATN